jgi:cytochrome b subunit of formate dehydrogenase
MAAKSKSKFEEYKAGAQHYVIMLIMIAGFFALFQGIVIPNAMSSFVRSLFSPYGEMLDKIGYAEFKDGV